jgi:hypothetical protein
MLPFAVALTLSLAPSVPARAAEEPVDLATLQRIFDEGLHRSQVMDTLSHLTDVIGPRLTGSPQLEAASAWARARLEGWGLANAHVERYPFGPGWSLEHVSLRMVAPDTSPLSAWPRAWTPGTDGPVRGHVTVAKLESEADFEASKGKLAGRIALVSKAAEIKGLDQPLLTRLSDAELREHEQFAIPQGAPDRLARFQKRRRFAAALHRFLAEERPLAAIQASAHEGGVIEVGGAGLRGTDDPRGVPQLVLAAEQYNRLLRLVERGIDVELELDVRATFHDKELTAPNTLGEIPGSGPLKNEVVMLGAHLDSWHAGTGATDNAAGSAVVMEAVRILRAIGAQPRRTVRAALWSGEEQGLLGSRAYVAQHFAVRPESTPEEPLRGPLKVLSGHARLAAYFNIDSGTGRVRGVLAQENLAAVPMLSAWIQPLRALGVGIVSPRRDFGSDHMAFDAVGLPAFSVLQDDVEYETLTHHTQLDVLDRVKRDDLVQASVVLASLVWQAAQRDEMPPRKALPPPSPAPPAATPEPAAAVTAN